MRKIIYILIFNLLISNDYENFGTFIFNANSSEAIGMSDATSSWLVGVSAISSNPAGLAALGYDNDNVKFLPAFNFEIGSSIESANVSSYGDTKFPYMAFGWGFKVPNTAKLFLGFAGSYQSLFVGDVEGWDVAENFMGYFNYSESAISAAVAIEYDPVRIGFKWIGYMQDVGSYGSIDNFEHIKETFFMPIEFGIQYKINNKTNVGLHFANNSRIGSYDYSLSRSKIGFSTLLNNKENKLNHLIATDFEKLSNDNGMIKIGYEGKFAIKQEDKIKLRLGLQSEVVQENETWDLMNSLQISGGLSFSIKNLGNKSLIIDVALKQHIYPTALSPLSRTIYFSLSYKKF